MFSQGLSIYKLLLRDRFALSFMGSIANQCAIKYADHFYAFFKSKTFVLCRSLAMICSYNSHFTA